MNSSYILKLNNKVEISKEDPNEIYKKVIY